MAEPTLERLERRLVRERAARKSAEQIAERQTLELYEANRALGRQSEDLKQRRAELEEALSYLRIILDQMADGLVVIDEARRIKLANRAFLRFFGLEGVRVSGETASDVLDPGLAEELARGHDLNDGELREVELPLPGNRIGAATLSTATSDSTEGKSLGVIALVRDITMAKEIDRMKTDFISNVSHELRTPLTSILGFTKIIRRNLDRRILPALALDEDTKLAQSVEKVRGNLDIIIAEGERLSKLINEVLDVAKMEAGQIVWNMEELDVGELVAHVRGATSGLFTDRPVTLVCRVDDGLPVVEADRDRLLQVLINLISNAAKFTDEGEVVCTARRRDGEIMVSVADTGVGIAPNEFDKVFEKFKQVGDTLTDKPKGTGLGLPISKQIVEHHGGRIWVESTLGVGTTFSFTLPVKHVELSTAPRSRDGLDVQALVRRLTRPAADVALEDAAGRGKTVLIVDDEPSIREYLKQELQADGYEVIEAIDGLDGITKAKELAPDLVILDVMMPNVNGFDAAAVLKNDPLTSHIPIMIHSIVEDRARGYRLGIDRYLAKPAETATLLQEVASLTTQTESNKTVLVVGEADGARDLMERLARSGEHALELVGIEGALERALSLVPDIIIIDASVTQHRGVVRRIRAESALEKIALYVLAEEQAAK